MDLKEEHILGDDIADHWYYQAKGEALQAILGELRCDSILDVGAGSGVFAKRLLDADVCSSATCVDISYPEDRDVLYRGKRIAYRRAAAPSSERLVLMMDVLEHVDDDDALLRAYVEPLPAGGHVLISVPAFQWLWSAHDVFLEHRRRYTLPQVERLVRGSGLEVVRSRYFFGTLLPLIAAVRLWRARRMRGGRIEPRSDLRRLPPLPNAALVQIHRLERTALFPWNRLGGLTVFCLARKPAA